MRRVELIVEVDKVKAADVLQRIESGEYPLTSMACRTPYDVCAVCGNKASSRSQYCVHLKDELLRVYPDGKQSMSLNVAPLRFFDISIVIRPADVTSSVLQKVASSSGEGADAYPISSAEMAERAGIDQEGHDEGNVKEAALRKLSELIKKVDDGMVTGVSESALDILSQVKSLPVEIIPLLYKLGSYSQILNAFAKLGINPPANFYISMLHADKSVSDYVKTRTTDGDFVQMHPPVVSEEPSPALLAVLKEHINDSSLKPEYVEKRAYYWDQVVGHRKETGLVQRVPGPEQKDSKLSHPVAMAAGALILNHYVNDDSKSKGLIDKIIGLFFGAALLSKLSVDELIHTQSGLKSSHGIDKQASACNINQEFVLYELLSMKGGK